MVDVPDGSPSHDAQARFRPRNARGEGEKLRHEIVDAMLRLIADSGRMQPIPVSLREVAREAGITAPAIYRHFEGKEELVSAVKETLFERLLNELDAAEASSFEETPERRLAALAHAYSRFAERNPVWFRVMFSNHDAHTDETAAVAARWRAAAVRLADVGMRLTQSPEAAAMSVWSSVHGRLVLEGTASTVWELGDVHDFIDVLARSLADIESPTAGDSGGLQARQRPMPGSASER